MSDAAADGFRKVDERVVHAGAVITVAVGTFEGPDGSTFERELVHHPGAVSVVAVDDQDRVVLVRQYRAALDAWMDELPAGKLDIDGEDPAEAVKRELIEEAGVSAARWELLAEFHNSPGFSDELGRIYLARDLTEVPDDRQGVEEDAMTVEWVPFADAVARVTSGELRDSKTVIGLLRARDRLAAG
ncbi:MAG: NUDIX hydrolase [Actinomycetota bacterium]|nr:NUDIX hydrolase [Acidimicrobiia bacterium]MDQ3294766.1 NUDIX hydrolase [Actinomycetota bacterium]